MTGPINVLGFESKCDESGGWFVMLVQALPENGGQRDLTWAIWCVKSWLY